MLRALGLGDLLTGLPALRGVSAAFPDHRVVLATPAPLAPLAMASGAVDGVVPARGLAALPGTVRRPDVAVNLHGSGPESHRLLAALEPERLIAFGNAHASVRGPAWRDDEHEVARWCRMLKGHGIGAEPSRLDLPAPGGPVMPGGDEATLVHPGAGAGARRWPPDRFAAVARAEADAGRRVIVTGGPGEVPLARGVAEEAGLGMGAVRAGRIDVLGLMRLVAGAGRIVVGDTGLAHLATAVGTPSVVLFGPTPPALWGPPRSRPWNRALWAGRTGDPHAADPDPGLLEITVPDVLDALRVLRGRPRVPVLAGGPDRR